MKSPLSTIGLTGILMVSSLAATVAVPLKASAQASAQCHIYQVKIQGTVVNNYSGQAFSVNQYAIWRDRGVRSNQFEFMLKTFTDLNVNPKVGQIELLTNSYFANNIGIRSAKIDLAKVQVANQVNFTLDSGASLQMPQPNVFVSPGEASSANGALGLGLLPGGGQELARIINGAAIFSASYLIPNRGVGSFGFTDNTRTTIVGQLDISGSALGSPGLNGRYTAAFRGNYLQSVACP